MNTKNIKYFIFAVFSTMAMPVLAQQPDNLNREVQVTRAYDPILSDANKIDVPIKVDDSLNTIKKEFQYSVLGRGINGASNYTMRPISAAKITGKPYTDPHFFYARLGVGYPLSPLADVYINNINPASLSTGAFYNFRSIFGEIANDNPQGKDIPIDEMSHNAGIFFKKHFEKLSIGVEGGYNRRSVLFYGYDNYIHTITDYTFDSDSLKQTYNSFDVKFNLTSNDSDPSTFRYNLQLQYNMFGDEGKKNFDIGRMFAMRENIYGGSLSLGKLVNDQHLIKLDLGFHYYNNMLKYNTYYNNYRAQDMDGLYDLYHRYYGQSTGRDSTDNRYEFTINPSYQFVNDNIELQLGVELHGDKENEENEFHVYPQAYFAYLAANEFTPYAAISGDHEINSYGKIASENPYILPGMNFGMQNTIHSYQAKVGAKGNVGSISYNVYADYSLIKDMYFYQNANQPMWPDTTVGIIPYRLYNNFDVTYDEVQQWHVGAELAASFRNVRALLKANYYNYSLNDLKAPFHRPAFTLDFKTDITIARYFILSASLYAQSESAYYYDNNLKKTYYNAGFFDAGVGAEYLFTRNFSVFANVHNLLNTKYMIWNNYKVPGIHFEGGITFKF